VNGESKAGSGCVRIDRRRTSIIGRGRVGLDLLVGTVGQLGVDGGSGLLELGHLAVDV
jgi:hypothetical protein